MKNANVIVTKTEITINSKPPRCKNAKAVYNISTGDYYASTIDAGEKIGVAQGHISQCCIGKSKTARGQHVIYVSDMPSHLEDISKAMKAKIKEKEECLVIIEELNNAIRARETECENEIARLHCVIGTLEAELASTTQKLEKVKCVFEMFSELKSELK